MNTMPEANDFIHRKQFFNLLQRFSSFCPRNLSTRSLSVTTFGFAFALALCAFLQTPSHAFAHENVVAAPDGTLHKLVETELTADHAPKPGEIVIFSLIATPHMEAPDLTIQWSVDNGAEIVNGTASDTIDTFTAHESQQFSRQIRFPHEGVYRVIASATIHPMPAAFYGDSSALYVTVRSDGSSTISWQNPADKSPMRSTMATTMRQLEPAVSASQINAPPCYTISGVITRTERTPTSKGYAPDMSVPVRYTHLTLWELDPISDDWEAEGITDVDGRYSFDFCDDDGFGGGGLELYLTLEVALYDPSGADWDDFEVVYVEDSSWIDEVYEYNSKLLTPPEGGSFEINMALDLNQSAAVNIADAIFDGWLAWKLNGGASGGDKAVDITAEVHWEIGYDEDGNTYYQPDLEEITVGDDAKRNDRWDDGVILHEYGHMIEDNYSCDESSGGKHAATQILDDPEFAWSEGFQDYFQSMVRKRANAPDPGWYLDMDGMTSAGSKLNLETWDVDVYKGQTGPVISPKNEMALAAMFWDLEDSASDGQDRVSHGAAMIQEVYTDDEFNNQTGDEECTVNEYFRAWQALNKPADTSTAAAITQNTGVVNPFTVVNTSDASQTTDYTMFDATGKSTDYQWWKHLIMVNDTSKSMEGAKISAVKTVLSEQISDIAQNPKGVEFSLYSFDNTKNTNTTLLAGKFYADLVTPAINSMSTSAAIDPGCPVDSLRAMAQAVGPKQKGDAWLFTDGDALQSVSVETLVKSLNAHKIKGSVALLGGCNSLPPAPTNVSGASKNYLGLAANASQQGGIVPYLLTAIGSGGQFLFVDSSKTNDAADILRAQLSHSAGAGRWSDYVSDNPTYLYDKLNSWEYKWVDTSTAAGGANQGVPSSQLNVSLPNSFTYFGTAFNNTYVSRYGYLTFGIAPSPEQSVNGAIPVASSPNNALYVLWDDLFWNNPPALAAASQPNQPNQADAMQVNVFSKQDGDWFAISTVGFGSTTGDERAYQVLLNSTTGEIRYQYKSYIDSSTATVGLENNGGTIATQVSLNDINGAKDGMGYKFTPAPAQPSKTYTVAVDGLMSSVGFLLSGYSGTFKPLSIRTPDNSLVSCADTTNVLCLDLGLVQFVQVKVNGRKGNWHATVGAGGSGAGTFSFSSIGASTISAESSSSRSLSTASQTIAMKLEKPVTGNQLDGWFTKPNGQAFGSSFRFFDDGAHNDGKAGDGRFGSDAFTPPSGGVAYLWVKGSVDGESFTRSEPTPFNFQPLEVTSLGDGINFGDKTPLVFEITNHDTVKHCYDRSTQVPNGWGFNWNYTITEFAQGLCLEAGQSVTRAVDIHMGALPNDLPSGANGEVFVSFVEKEEGAISGSASATVTRHRAANYIVINNKTLSSYLRPTGTDTTTLQIFVYDDQNVSVADGTVVNISTSLGTISPTLTTQKGHVDPIFTTGLIPGKALITVQVDSLTSTTAISIESPIADSLALSSDKSELPASQNNATITAKVTDAWGNPVANQSVQLSVSGDGEMGTIGNGEIMTGTTNASGEIITTFARGSQNGKVTILAQLITVENGQTHAALNTVVAINVVGTNDAPAQKIFLPLVSR